MVSLGSLRGFSTTPANTQGSEQVSSLRLGKRVRRGKQVENVEERCANSLSHSAPEPRCAHGRSRRHAAGLLGPRCNASPSSFALCEGRCGVVGTCSGGANDGEASRRRRGAMAGLNVFWDATVGGQLMAKGRAELRELLLGLRGGQQVVRGGWE